MWFLTMEDIISNSLLEMNKMGDCDGILIDDAIRYGNMVAKDLCKKGFFTKVKINSCMINSFDKSYYPYFLKFLYCDTFGYQIRDNAFIHDIEKRFKKHVSGSGAKYTKSHQAEKIEAAWRSKDKSLACKLEYQIKHLEKKQKEELINDVKLSTYLKGKVDCRRYSRIKLDFCI